NAGRLYHHFVAGAVDATDVAPSLDDEAFRDELQVRSANLFFESFQHLSVPISKPLMNTNKHESESNQFVFIRVHSWFPGKVVFQSNLIWAFSFARASARLGSRPLRRSMTCLSTLGSNGTG